MPAQVNGDRAHHIFHMTEHGIELAAARRDTVDEQDVRPGPRVHRHAKRQVADIDQAGFGRRRGLRVEGRHIWVSMARTAPFMRCVGDLSIIEARNNWRRQSCHHGPTAWIRQIRGPFPAKNVAESEMSPRSIVRVTDGERGRRDVIVNLATSRSEARSGARAGLNASMPQPLHDTSFPPCPVPADAVQ